MVQQSKTNTLTKDASSQMSDLRETISDLGEQVAEIAAERGRDAKRRARSAAKTVRSASSSMYDDGLDALQTAGDSAAYYGRRASGVMRSNPGLSLLGLAVGLGVIAAIVYAAQEDDHRWYERKRGGWF